MDCAELGRLLRASIQMQMALLDAFEASAKPVGTKRLEAENNLKSKVITVVGQAGKPLKGSAIAGRCGAKYSSHFRQLLATMKRDGFLRKVADGYELSKIIPKDPELDGD